MTVWQSSVKAGSNVASVKLRLYDRVNIGHLELVRTAAYMDNHRAEQSQQRFRPIQKLSLSHCSNALPDLIFGISSHLIELLTLFFLGRRLSTMTWRGAS